MAAVSWLILLCTYPDFARWEAAEFARHHEDYTRKVGRVVGPLLLLQLGGHAWLVFGGGEGWPALGLVLAIHAKPLHVLVGEPVTYTYHIANRGPNTFANLGVVDDRLGKVAGLSRRLVPGAEDTTALAYGTQTQDVGKLENVVTLTGNDTYGRPVTRQVRVVVTVTARLFLPHLPR